MKYNEYKPQVSIVLPVYNGERFLSEAIDSILSQTFTDWELIIVNDCSTDGSRRIMSDYAAKDSRIKIVDNEKNLKLPRSLNVGFREARGEYYTWTSDDNILKPDMLDTLVKELNMNQNYGMIYSDCDEIDESGSHISDRRLNEPKDLGVIGNVCGASFLYRKEVAEAVGEYDPTMFLAEDYDYWLRIYSIANIEHIPAVLYSCRRHNKSLTATRRQQIAEQTYNAICKNLWILLKKTNTKKERRDLYKMLYSYAINRDDKRKILMISKEMCLYVVCRGISGLISRFCVRKGRR